MVSVLMCLHKNDSVPLFQRAIKSIAEQTLLPNQIVLVIDGPITDEHEIVLSEFNYLPFDEYRLSTNLGFAKALNYGIKFCKFDIIIRCDSDDENLPTRFKKLVDALVLNENYAVVGSHVNYIDDLGRNIGTREVPLTYNSIKKAILYVSPMNHPSVAFRKSIIQKAGGYPDFRYSQDHALWALLIMNKQILINLDENLVNMNAGSAMFSRRGKKNFVYEIKIAKYKYKIGLINLWHYLVIIVYRLVIFITPVSLKKLYIKFKNR